MIERIHHSEYHHENHWYPKVLHAQMTPLVRYFFQMGIDQIISRYCHLHPTVDKAYLREMLFFKPRFFNWSGADLINVATEEGKRSMVLIETNSCPSGQKSTPQLSDQDEYGGYGRLVRGGVQSFLKGKRLPKGVLAVFYDKNLMEASGYAFALSEFYDEEVFFVPFYTNRENDHIRIEQDQFHIRLDGAWKPVRFAFRYLTQKPWNRLPTYSRTAIFNPLVVCLAGGRNKLLASKAYEFFNSDLQEQGIQIHTPETYWDIHLEEVPFWYRRFGGHLVVKNPYANAGQGIFLITNETELEHFMQADHNYENFLVQSLIGNTHWSSHTEKGKLYHVGTLPNKKNETFVSDLRVMIHFTKEGFRPLGMYSRRADLPLPDYLDDQPTWPILGTNLSVKKGENSWETDVNRLIIMDQKDFNKLGLGIDDLIEAFMQTVFATVAIDKMSQRLINRSNGRLKRKLFSSLNPDASLLREIL